MSVASRPTVDSGRRSESGALDGGPEPAATDADGWALLEALRRRLDDQSAQGRKTQLQVTQLTESIGALVESQRRREKSLNLNSFVAYLIFTLLVGSGFYALYRSRATELVDARDSAQRERDLASRRAVDATAKLAAREQADGRAWEVYQLLEAGKRVDAVGKLSTLSELPLSRTERAVLAARAHETQVMEVDAALKSAAASFKAGRWADVVAPLEAALVGEPAGARSSAMHYYLGVAYAKANDLVKAIDHLQFAIVADGEHDDARFQLASALDRSGQYARARGEYDRFATAHPQSSLAVFAMRRSGTLARMPAVAPQPVAPPAPPAITPAPGAATPTGAVTRPLPGAAATATATAPPSTGAAPAATPLPTGSAAVLVTPKPAPAKPVRVWKPMPKKPAAAKPAPTATTPAPKTLDFSEPDVAGPQSAADIERPGSAPPRDTIDAAPPRTARAPTPLPAPPTDRTPAPWPQPDLHDKPRAPESPGPPTPAPVESQPLTIAVPSGW